MAGLAAIWTSADKIFVKTTIFDLGQSLKLVMPSWVSKFKFKILLILGFC